MIKEIKMPAGGQTTDTSTIGTWLVKKGDKVKRGDALLEIETDKATLTVESFAKGTVLALLAEEGDQRSAGDVIALVGEESDAAEAEQRLSGGAAAAERGSGHDAASYSTGAAPAQEDEYQPIDKSMPTRYAGEEASGTERGAAADQSAPGNKKVWLADVKAMPNAKKTAWDNGVSLEAVAEFTGKDILKRRDVENYIENSRMMGTEPGAAKEQAPEEQMIPHTTMRRVIARRMTESAQTIPVFSATVVVDMTRCIEFRKTVNAAGTRKISFNDILFKCMTAAIRQYPLINATYTEEGTIVHRAVNIGLAVSVEGGLVVPVVKDVSSRTISEIAVANKENIAKARAGKLAPDDMSGGTITLSNLGMYAIDQFQAIINPPESCILAVGATEDRPVLVDGEWKSVPTMKITASFDHRIIDGACGAQFLTELKKVIENPALALL
ncbi:dihydrolipoamide acetyltransferase family protein [Hespellia stercorisuis]|uniref:Dihydrolipoamide acetyltransferase component of pyruvate dehydrogenase complex n=1 Tax=Hespellia stercorisuis DSM 15480 TaxID=1121950 RepID=A0A1M6J7R0_9FIRM|nr:dihydrolipoamide acetyltransferase family protein [Hespellia stercorisuis]SHJ42712.1 pyruvate dehydrogenase E2 component (dihydrolipoamide acetyltransferase) [Hespellia stercorisuis DSM 15480]